jgi:hypothetical protein
LELLSSSGVASSTSRGHLLLKGTKITKTNLLATVKNLLLHGSSKSSKNEFYVLLGDSSLLLQFINELSFANRLRKEKRRRNDISVRCLVKT